MKQKKRSEESRIKSILSRIRVVAANGVDFNFYQCWEAPLSMQELSLLRDEKELGMLEIKLDEKVKGKRRG